MREQRKLLARRLVDIEPVVDLALATGQPAIVVPGEDEHNALTTKLVLAAWQWGDHHAGRELAAKARRRKELFNEPSRPSGTGPPPLDAIEWARKRTVLQGKWNRDLDATVTQVLVNALETGATKRDVMGALRQVFPTFGRGRLENIARTETTAAYNQGRLAMFGQGNVRAVQFVAILDARTTVICQSRNGMIMMLDDPRLPANTPPLHFQCRSVLIPVDRWDLADLEAGDPKAWMDFFGWLSDNEGPSNLHEALNGWGSTPPALPGFGKVSGPTARSKPKPKPKPVPKKSKPKPSKKTPAVRRTKLARAIDDRVQKGLVTPDDVKDVGSLVLDASKKKLDAAQARHDKKLASLDAKVQRLEEAQRKAKTVEKKLDYFDQIVEAQKERRELREKLQEELTEQRRDILLANLKKVRNFGNPTEQTWASGSQTPVKEALAKVQAWLPTDWSLASNGQAIKGRIVARGYYEHWNPKLTPKLYISGEPERHATVALHEFGHRMEELRTTIGKLGVAYRESRTKGEKVVSLRKLTGINYSLKEKSKPDKFTHPYMGKLYTRDHVSEIISMGLEGLLLGTSDFWTDEDYIRFMLGVLAAL